CYVSSFFFSSRRRHTRFSRDWSSDVCSSDLGTVNSDRDGNRGGWATPGDDQSDAESAVEATGEFTIDYAPPAWYTQNAPGGGAGPAGSPPPAGAGAVPGPPAGRGLEPQPPPPPARPRPGPGGRAAQPGPP